ncbi:MAG: hypothetical protein R3E50_11025 [Halioglobus sp.]
MHDTRVASIRRAHHGPGRPAGKACAGRHSDHDSLSGPAHAQAAYADSAITDEDLPIAARLARKS